MSPVSVGTMAEAVALAHTIQGALGWPPPPVSVVPELLNYVQGVFDHAIRIHRDNDMEADDIFGILERHADRAEIIIPDLNSCWSRFVVTKECMHLLFDSPKTFAVSASAQLQAADNMRWPTDKSDKLDSESYARVVAFEVLFPFQHRPPRAEVTDNNDVANQFKIPEIHIENYYVGGYGTLSEEINGQLGTSLSVHPDGRTRRLGGEPRRSP